MRIPLAEMILGGRLDPPPACKLPLRCDGCESPKQLSQARFEALAAEANPMINDGMTPGHFQPTAIR